MKLEYVTSGKSRRRAPQWVAFTMMLIWLSAVPACSSRQDLLAPDGTSMIGASGISTLVNLHPDAVRNRLYAVNYLQGGLIPACSDVEFVEFNGKHLKFLVRSTGQEYVYIHHKAAGEPFPDHLHRFFGKDCPKAEIARLAGVDKQGVQTGEILVGMSKRAVILAVGYPPRHVTPNTDSNKWTYWKSRYDRLLVTFNDRGIVTEVRD